MAVDGVTGRPARARSVVFLLASTSVVAIATIPGSCSPGPDLEADRAALLRLRDEQRAAHLEKDAERLVSSFSDSFLSIEEGEVERPSRPESLRAFRSYLESVEFLEWEDIEPPVIRISADGSMAYVIVHKRVRLVPVGGGTPRLTVYAWLETWEKRDGEWELTAVASTDRPGDPVAEDTGS